jgi:hypothetical protein
VQWSGEVLEAERSVLGDAKNFVDQAAMLAERRGDLPDELDLLVANKTSALYQHDASMKLAFAYELLEVADVQRYEDAILLVRAIEQLVVGRSFETAISDVPRVDALASQGDCSGRRDILIEQ